MSMPVRLSENFLDGKTAIVTGGGRGIGKATAQILADYGAFVCVVSRSKENSAQTAESIRTAGGKAEGYPCDVADSSAVERCVADILATRGTIHILVNNAGITKDNLILRMKNEDWDEVLKTNLSGAFYFCKEVAKPMVKQRNGAIVNIASVVGITGNAGQANYAASKAGIIGLTKSLAKELASRKITVNAVAPGFIATDMTGKLPEKARTELQERIPLGNLGNPEDVAQAVLFLVSPLASYITGQILKVDGGMVM